MLPLSSACCGAGAAITDITAGAGVIGSRSDVCYRGPGSASKPSLKAALFPGLAKRWQTHSYRSERLHGEPSSIVIA